MSKKPDELPNEQQEQKKQPAHVEELMKNGKVVLEAPTMEALADMVNDIPADCRYSVGAVGHKADGTRVLQVDIIK